MAKKTLKGTTIDPDFKVSDRIRELAVKNGWPDPDQQVDEFVDHHLRDGSLYSDWEAAFRTWLRNAKRWGKSVPIQPLQAPRKPQVKTSFPEEEKTKPEDLKVMMAQLDEVLSKVGNGGVPTGDPETGTAAERKQKLLEQARKLGVKL